MKSRPDFERLQELRDYLAQVQQACKMDSSTLTAVGRSAAALDTIHQTALEVEDDFVLRYGIVGDSNAGKSLLISALLGIGRALPVNPFPETGNITILRVRNDDALRDTQMGSYRLNFLTQEKARDCLKRLHEEVAKELNQLRAAQPAHDVMSLLPPANAPIDLRAVIAWIGTAWPTLPAGLDIRNRLIELARFCCAWHLLGSIVAGRQEVEVTQTVAEAAMVLPQNSTADKAAETDPIISSILTAGSRPPLAEWPRPLTVEFARACYPLVRDIRVDAWVPSRTWDLRALHVGAIELFDFPGLRASKTAARDRMLGELEREADRIHAWLLVVNAADLTGTQASQLLRELEADRVLAVANRFDELSLAQQGYLRELEAMVAADAREITQAHVVERIRPLEPLTSTLPDLAPPERTAVVSALLGLVELDRQPDVLGRILTIDQRDDWVHDIARGQAARETWRGLPSKIAPQTRDTTLVPWLTEYTKPGGQAGIAYLRQLLAKHANEQGIGLLARERRKPIRKLESEIQAFLIRLDCEIDESRQEADAILDALATLENTLRDHQTISSEIGALRMSPLALNKYKLLPKDVKMHTYGVTEPRSLCEIVRDEVLMRVHDWPVWKALFDATGPDGFVEYVPPAPSKWGKAVVRTPPPMRAGELHALYRQSYVEVERLALAHIKAALCEALDRIAAELAPLAAVLRDLPATGSGEIVGAALRVNSPEAQAVLFEKLEPAPDAAVAQNSFWMRRFPFLMPPDANGQLTLGPYFGWAPERGEPSRGAGPAPADGTNTRVRNKTQHQSAVFRLRYELATMIETEILRDLALGLQAFRQEFTGLIETVHQAVGEFRNLPIPDLLALFRRGDAEGATTLPELQLRGLHVPAE